MNKRLKLFTVFVLFILLFSIVSFGLIFLVSDNEKPKIMSVTGDITASSGGFTSISVEFSDNEKVTEAFLYFKQSEDKNWDIISIFDGVADIRVPLDSKDDIYYYVTVNDAAGNGPVGIPSSDGEKYFVIDVVEEEKLVSNAFVEEATTTWCSNCPQVAESIHDLYDSDIYNFYYVSMVSDKNSVAESRLNDGYNTYGFPSVYIDGGYRFFVGQGGFKTGFRKALSEANGRDKPEVFVNLDSVWNRENKVLENTVEVMNKDNKDYEGKVKVYICEKRSVRWSDYEGNPYRFAFLDYGLEESVNLGSGKNVTFSEEWIPSDSKFEEVSVENLFMVAVVFNDRGVGKEYESDGKEKKSFKAFYADDCDGCKALSGELPPSIGLMAPKEFSHYIRGRERHNFLFQNTYILGKVDLKVKVQADSGVDRVEYIIKGSQVEDTVTVYDKPYSYEWDSYAFGRFTITAQVYDKKGRTASDSIEVFAFIF